MDSSSSRMLIEAVKTGTKAVYIREEAIRAVQNARKAITVVELAQETREQFRRQVEARLQAIDEETSEWLGGLEPLKKQNEDDAKEACGKLDDMKGDTLLNSPSVFALLQEHLLAPRQSSSPLTLSPTLQIESEALSELSNSNEVETIADESHETGHSQASVELGHNPTIPHETPQRGTKRKAHEDVDGAVDTPGTESSGDIEEEIPARKSPISKSTSPRNQLFGSGNKSPAEAHKDSGGALKALLERPKETTDRSSSSQVSRTRSQQAKSYNVAKYYKDRGVLRP